MTIVTVIFRRKTCLESITIYIIYIIYIVKQNSISFLIVTTVTVCVEGIEKDNGKIWLFPRNALPLQHIYIIRYQMKKEITVEYMHDLLKKSVFKNVDLSKVEGMSDDERRKFTVAEADDLLGQREYGDSMYWYVGQFLHDDGMRRLDNPLYQEEGALANWYIELADFGYALLFHIHSDLDYLEPGLGQHQYDFELDYTLGNERLTKWLHDTPYRRLAVMTARIMLDLEYERVVAHFDAVQDYYAEHCTTDFGGYLKQDAKCDKYIDEVLHCIQTVSDHQQQGRALGLSDDEMRVVDALWGWMPHDYDKDCVEAARDICQAVEASLPAPTVIRSRNGFIAYKKPVMKQLEAIAKKHDVDIDLTDEYNITMGYLTEWLYAKYSRGLIDNDDDLIG